MTRRLLSLPALLGVLWAASSAAVGQAQTERLHAASHVHVSFHRLWTQQISPNADSAPAYLAHPGNGSSPPMLYVLAANNGSNCNPGNPVRKATLYALNAGSGAIRWTRSTSGPSRCSTAGPVVDPTGRWVYVPGLDGKVHRYDALTGRETTGSGWPVTVTLMPQVEKISATPTIKGSHLYVTTSGFIGDQGHYQGHVVTIDLAHHSVRVFNSLCSNIHVLLGSHAGAGNYCPAERSGFFGRGQATVDPITGWVFVVTGNGAWDGKTNWGDSVLKLNPAGSTLLDSYTPTNQQALDSSDQDLGSTGSALLPPIRLGGRTYHLLTQGGKGPACNSCQGVAVRLLNQDNLSGAGGKGHLGGDLFDAQAPGGCEILTTPAVWKHGAAASLVFYANDCGLAAYRVGVRAGQLRLDRVWSSGVRGTTPVLSGGVLYVASSGHVTAFDPATGNRVGAIAEPGDIHWEYPTIAGHRLFISDESGHVSCYALAG